MSCRDGRAHDLSTSSVPKASLSVDVDDGAARGETEGGAAGAGLDAGRASGPSKNGKDRETERGSERRM